MHLTDRRFDIGRSLPCLGFDGRYFFIGQLFRNRNSGKAELLAAERAEGITNFSSVPTLTEPSGEEFFPIVTAEPIAKPRGARAFRADERGPGGGSRLHYGARFHQFLHFRVMKAPAIGIGTCFVVTSHTRFTVTRHVQFPSGASAY
jgi:hypothetical protein